jgi:tetratricopeptide (TPR) repeat protein
MRENQGAGNMKNQIGILVIIGLVLINISCATPREKIGYEAALSESKSANIYFSLMKFKEYLKEFPDSPYSRVVKFAISEYYFEINDYRDAMRQLKEYIEEYPQDRSAVFAKALLYRIISGYMIDPELKEKIKEEFFSKSIFLIFSGSKMKSYKSILNNTYKIVDYIDKIEFYKNNELLIEIRP